MNNGQHFSSVQSNLSTISSCFSHIVKVHVTCRAMTQTNNNTSETLNILLKVNLFSSLVLATGEVVTTRPVRLLLAPPLDDIIEYEALNLEGAYITTVYT